MEFISFIAYIVQITNIIIYYLLFKDYFNKSDNVIMSIVCLSVFILVIMLYTSYVEYKIVDKSKEKEIFDYVYSIIVTIVIIVIILIVEKTTLYKIFEYILTIFNKQIYITMFIRMFITISGLVLFFLFKDIINKYVIKK
jgi:hypothetical protein